MILGGENLLPYTEYGIRDLILVQVPPITGVLICEMQYIYEPRFLQIVPGHSPHVPLQGVSSKTVHCRRNTWGGLPGIAPPLFFSINLNKNKNKK
jgi:hypothetical protein